MKKIILSFLFFMNIEAKEENLLITNELPIGYEILKIDIKEFCYRSHSYICFDKSIIHNPDCWCCQKNERPKAFDD